MKTKKQLLKESLALKLALGVLGLFVVGGTVKAVPVGFWEMVADKVSSSLVSQILGNEETFGASGTRFPHGISANTTSPLEGEVLATTLTANDSLRLQGASDFTNREVDVQDWPTDTYLVYFQNPYDGTAYVKDVNLLVTGTVSSTFQFDCGVTSTIVSAYNDSPSTENLIDDLLIVTSTANTVYSNTDDTDQGTSGKAVASATDNQYVFCRAVQIYNNGCTGSVCESVTSTNRGWQGELSVEWEWSTET